MKVGWLRTGGGPEAGDRATRSPSIYHLAAMIVARSQPRLTSTPSRGKLLTVSSTDNNYYINQQPFLR